MNKLDQLPWPLIIGMGALALVHPFLNMVGLMDGLGRPFGPLFVMALISATWLAIVVLGRVRQPLLTLIATGAAYGLFAIVISAIFSPLLTGQFAGPLSNPFATIAVLITNAIWGALVGLFAWGLQRMLSSARQP